MNSFDSDGIEIAFIDEGAGAPVLLIHGFASNVVANWVDPGWVRTLVRAGYRVVAFDNRGHGESEKLYDEAVYGAELMAEDARRLLDHLDIARADVMGYSMGARITAFLAIGHPERVRSAVFGGYGINMVRGVAARPVIAEGLEAASLDEVTDPTARAFRIFAESSGSDLRALAVCFRAAGAKITIAGLESIAVPVLCAVGTDDNIAGSAAELAALMPAAEVLDIPGRDHMRAVGDRVYKDGVVEFLGRRG